MKLNLKGKSKCNNFVDPPHSPNKEYIVIPGNVPPQNTIIIHPDVSRRDSAPAAMEVAREVPLPSAPRSGPVLGPAASASSPSAGFQRITL